MWHSGQVPALGGVSEVSHAICDLLGNSSNSEGQDVWAGPNCTLHLAFYQEYRCYFELSLPDSFFSFSLVLNLAREKVVFPGSPKIPLGLLGTRCEDPKSKDTVFIVLITF